MLKNKKSFVATAMAGILFASSAIGFAIDVPTFSDMPPVGHYARKALESAVGNSLLSGYDGKIMPFGNVTRAQMAAIMNKVMGATQKASLTNFTDMDPKAWYYEDMAKAVFLKIFMGNTSQGKLVLNPMSNITREQVCVVLANAFNLKSFDISTLNRFADVNKIDAWAKDGVAAMVSAGYINGNRGYLKPLDFITRAELAAILNNMIQTYFNKAGVYEGIFQGNVMINAPGVTFKDATIKGDLYIGDGFGSNELSLDGLIVTGRIVIKGSALITELELIEEEIALGGNGNQTPGTPSMPGTPGTPQVSDNTTKLVSVNSKLESRVVPLLTTTTQIQAAQLIMDSISKYIANNTYDISADVEAAKVLGAKMTADEYAYFKNSITGNIPISELVALNNYFKVIEY